MSYFRSRTLLRLVSPPAILAATLLVFISSTKAQSVEKMADFRNLVINGSYFSGSSNPYDNSIQIGNQLWFTTNRGGANDVGTISYYDLTTRTITAYASMNVASGNTPQSSLTRVGDQLYFTTTRGGTGDTGTISSVTMGQANPTISTFHNFGSTATTTNPRNPGGSLTAVGNDLYYTTPNGGTGGSAYGTISRYNVATGTNSVVYNFTGTGAANGRQPSEGFTNVGGKLYFTTFTGGSNAGTGFPNGTGTLSVFDPATGGVSTVASTPSGNGLFPSHNVTQGSNGLLYFTTVGNATNPGSIQSFNLNTGVLATVYALTGAPTSSGPFPDGRFAYGSLAEYNKVLYFATFGGGANGFGTINAFDLNTNTFSKLADLDGAAATGLQLGSNTRGGFTIVNENGVDYLYLMTNAGGAYGSGTMLRLTPVGVPEPGTMAMVLAAGVGGWLWRRRRAGGESTPFSLEKEESSRPARSLRRTGEQEAFTLVELLLALVIVAVVMGITFPVFKFVTEKGRETACLSNLRQIGAAYYGYARDHDNYFPTAEAIGNSNYRRADDPLGLPMLFEAYLGIQYTKDGKKQGSKVWVCPNGRPTLKEHGNNYAWSRSDNVTTRPVSGITSIGNTLLAWDNFTMTLPSVNNVPEATSGGPRAASPQYRYYPHRSFTKANYLYADGHAGVL